MDLHFVKQGDYLYCQDLNRPVLQSRQISQLSAIFRDRMTYQMFARISHVEYPSRLQSVCFLGGEPQRGNRDALLLHYKVHQWQHELQKLGLWKLLKICEQMSIVLPGHGDFRGINNDKSLFEMCTIGTSYFWFVSRQYALLCHAP